MATSSRRSKRKRQSPARYGFDDERIVRHKQQTDDGLSLMDFPVEVLRRALSYVGPSLSDRFALQTTNKLFRNLSNENTMIRNMQLLLPPTTDSADDDDDSFASPLPIIQERDSSELIIRRLLPFAEAGNKDALLVLGLQAIYVEDDTRVGLRLLQRGMDDAGDLRSKYSIACFLRIWAPDTSRRLLEEATQAGHALSSLSPTAAANAGGLLPYLQRKREARLEMASIACLEHLIAKKSSPGGYHCNNPLCFRECYKVNKKRVKEWLKQKGYTFHWLKYRRRLMALGSPIPDYSSQGAMHWVSDFGICGRCREANYCCGSCQHLHWPEHKLVCGR